MNTKHFPSGWDERVPLDLESIPLWDPMQYTSHVQSHTARGNKSFKELWSETETMLPKLMAYYRWAVFGIPQKNFASFVGLSPHGYRRCELDLEGMPQFHIHEQCLAFLRINKISVGIQEQFLDLRAMPNRFEQSNRETGELYEPSKTLLQTIEEVRKGIGEAFMPADLINFYYRIGFCRGHETMQKKLRTDAGQKDFFGMQYARSYTLDTVPKAPEVLQVIDVMYDGTTTEEKQLHALRRAEGEGLWMEVKKQQYRRRGIEEVLAELLTRMELEYAKNWEWHECDDTGTQEIKAMTLTAEAMRTVHNVDDLASQLLVKCEMVKWQAIETAAQALFLPDEYELFKAAWESAYTLEQDRYCFRNIALQSMQHRKYSYKNLADLLGVKILEENRKLPEAERLQRDRPESTLRNIILFNSQSTQVPIESLLRILTNNEEEYGELRGLYEQERTRHYYRTGATLAGAGLQMRILRELANMSTSALALHFLPEQDQENTANIRQMDLELQALERDEIHKLKNPTVTHARVTQILEAAILQREQEAYVAVGKFNEFPEMLKEFTAVSQMATNCIRGMNGAIHVSDAMRDIAEHDSLWLRPDVIQEVADGTYVPPLPCLRYMSKGTINMGLSLKVIEDWYCKFPYQLMKGVSGFSHRQLFTQPLPRALLTLIASKDATPIRFFKRTEGIVPKVGTKLILEFENENIDVQDWQKVRKILYAVGIHESHPTWTIIQYLFEHEQDMNGAIKAVLPLLTKLRYLITPQNIPGVLSAELEAFI